MTHWPVICSYSAIACFGKSIWGVHPLKSRNGTQTPQISHKNWGKELVSTNFMKICMIWKSLFTRKTGIRFPVFAGHPYGMDVPGSEMIFIFQKVTPTWNQPDLSYVYMAACLLHIRNTSFASLLGDRRDLVGHIIRPDWLKTLTGCRAAWCEEQLRSKRSQSCKRIIIKQMQSNWTTVMFVTYYGFWNLKNCLNVHL